MDASDFGLTSEVGQIPAP